MSDLQSGGPRLHAQLSGYLGVFQDEYELEFDEPAEPPSDSSTGAFEMLVDVARKLLTDNHVEPDTLQDIEDARLLRELSSAPRAFLESGFTRDREQFAIAREITERLADVSARSRVALLAILKLSRYETSPAAFSLLKRPADLFLAGFDSATILMCEECLEHALASRYLSKGRRSQGRAHGVGSVQVGDRSEPDADNGATSKKQQGLFDRLREERAKIDLSRDHDADRSDLALLLCAELLADLLPAVPVSETQLLVDRAVVRGLPNENEAESPDARDIESIDRDELICLVRQIFADGLERERSEAIVELARALGHQRTGSRISDALDRSLRTAVRRGILDNSSSTLKIGARSIDDYERAAVKEQFLASLGGRHWVDRADAIRGFARWLGFRRTGVAIEDNARSAINGLIREMRLESDGRMIRRSP